MTRYYRVSLGRGGAHAAQALAEGWVGTGWMPDLDLSGKFHDEWRDFNKAMIPVVMQADGIASKVAAGLACGMTWTVNKGLKEGDVVLSSNGRMQFQVGIIKGDYYYAPGEVLPHRRPVEWLPVLVSRSDMTTDFNSRFTPATVQELTGFKREIDELVARAGGKAAELVQPISDDTDNPYVFVLEKYLEDVLSR